ncbi:MAG: hypothetical protein R3Y50_02550 [Rikenellaceae bacterium]
MKLKNIFSAAFLLLAAYSASAQDPIDIFGMAQGTYSFSTARSTAMGGAFTSLGADGASAAINPAGIGMYKGSDWSITASYLGTNIDSKASGPLGTYSTSDNMDKGIINNVSIIQNVFLNDKTTVRSANIGFVFNKNNDFNTNQYTSGNYETTSMLDMFASQLSGISPSDILSPSSDPMEPYRYMPVSLWGSMMAYNTGLLYVTDNSPYTYGLSYEDSGTLFLGDETYPDFTQQTSGYSADYIITSGVNLLDKLYVGATVAFTDYKYSRYQLYSEYANLDNNVGDLDIFDYRQNLTTSASGINMKLGVTYEPIRGIKIGVAYHTPTAYSVREEYYALMDSYYTTSPSYLYADTPYSLGEYRVRTPSKFLFGVSTTLANTAILSFDYDRTNYHKMKVTDGLGSEGENSLNSEIADTYKASNNYRFGAEIKLGGYCYLRGGYAYYGNPLKNESDEENNWQNISGGFGFKAGGFYMDVTYVNMVSNSSPQYFYYDSYSGIHSEQTFANKTSRNSLMFTLGARF